MALTVSLLNGLSGNPEFMIFSETTSNPLTVIFNKPTFELKVDDGNKNGSYINVYERGVMYNRKFYFSDFSDINGDTPGNVDNAFQLLVQTRALMV